jgi:hypothetical protein
MNNSTFHNSRIYDWTFGQGLKKTYYSVDPPDYAVVPFASDQTINSTEVGYVNF